ncbi:tyrosine-type recombinase/integrase [Streptomyces harbinensis]|uniref:tyrosine-type recombinase/integrase n=1 Tax=Streptomyces harbinensis TaxID=1176198 RepID=UPI003681133A
MAGYIEDRWLKKRPNPETGKRDRTALWGKGKRYKVTGIPGVRARSFDSATEAKRWKSKAEHEAQSGEFVDTRLGQITLTGYVEEHWWPTKSGDPATLSTIRGRLGHIKELLGAQPLNAIKAPQLRAFLKGLESRIGASTTREVWSTLSSVLQAAVDDERIRKNYCRSKTIQLPVSQERKVEPWSRSRVQAVRDALPERYRALMDVGVAAGLRQGEVFGLAVEDVDEEAGVLRVRRQVKKVGAKLVFALPKRGKTRDVPVPAVVIEAIKRHMKQFPPKKVTLPWGDPEPPTTEKEAKERAHQTFELIFTSTRGLALRRDSWNTRYWKPALAAAGVIAGPVQVRSGKRNRVERKYPEAREHGFHVLRHTAASVWLDAREPVVAVSSWLGHADASSTLRVYAHMMPEADGRGREAMHAWFVGT